MFFKISYNSMEQLVFILIPGMKRPTPNTQLKLSKSAHCWAPGNYKTNPFCVNAIRKVNQQEPNYCFKKSQHTVLNQ